MSAKQKGKSRAIIIGTPFISRKRLLVFTRQMATLVSCGVPLVRTLDILAQQAPKPVDAVVISNIANSVRAGKSLSEALSGEHKTFDSLYISMVNAGEASGQLDTVLDRLAIFLEKSQALKRKVIAALAYPIVVLIVAFGVTLFLMTFIVPKFAENFQSLGGSDMVLPVLTQWVMLFSNFILSSWYMILLGLIVLYVLYRLIGLTKRGRYFYDSVKLKIPGIGGLVTKIIMVRFGSTLSTLLSAGVTILTAFSIVRDITGNVVVEKAIQNTMLRIKEGAEIAVALEKTRCFPPMVIGMVEVGEETGALSEMLGHVGNIYMDEVDRTVEVLTSLIEPLLIIILAVIVAVVVLSMVLPMLNFVNTMSQRL